MRKKHDIESKFEAWKRAGYGNKVLPDIQEQEVRRAFMGGVFEGLNLLISLMDKEPSKMEKEVQELYGFLRAFHDNEIAVNSKSPFGKKYF